MKRRMEGGPAAGGRAAAGRLATAGDLVAVLAILALLLGGCQAPQKKGPPAAPSGIRIYVSEPVDEAGESPVERIEALRSLIRRAIKDETTMDAAQTREEAAFVLRVRVRRLDPGNRILKFAVGFGLSGAGYEALCELRDGAGKPVRSFSLDAFFPYVARKEEGTYRLLMEDMARAVARDLQTWQAPPASAGEAVRP